MRPHTVAEACARVIAGADFARTMGEFLDAFYLTVDEGQRVAMLAEEPASFGDPRYDALVAGMAEYLFKRYARLKPPPWIADPKRYLRGGPWFPFVAEDPGLREYLTFVSPPEFKSRNIMTDARPFRRASLARLDREMDLAVPPQAPRDPL